MGIDIAELVKEAPHGMYMAGFVPDRLAQIVRDAELRHSPFGEPSDFIGATRRIAADFNVEINVDASHADILVTTAPGDLEEHPASFAAAARNSESAEPLLDLFIRGIRGDKFRFPLGAHRSAKRTDLPADRQSCRAWRPHPAAARVWARLAPRAGRLRSGIDDRCRSASCTWSNSLPSRSTRGRSPSAISARVRPSTIRANSCDEGTRGRARLILRALGFELRELDDHGVYSYCCGGGGGVLANARAEPLRLKVFDLKRRQIEATGATHFVTSCGQCRLTFAKGAKHFGWEKPIESLLELVAENMIVPTG